MQDQKTQDLQKCFEKYDNGDYTRRPYAVSACCQRQHHVGPTHSRYQTTALMSLTLPTTLTTRIQRTPRLRPPGPPSPSPPLQTLLIVVKSGCFYRVMVWLWCRAGILASVAVAQTLSHPWTVMVARYAAHPFAWCCVCMAKCTLSAQ